jgi:hypothetical protein
MMISPVTLCRSALAAMLLMLAPCAAQHQGTLPPIQGELKLWHKLTFDFAGPASSESATPNPFTDYRMDVTFTHPASGTSYRVPGYFAADGNAAETSADAGDIWRAHFAPDAVGDWTYSVSFRSGSNVAMADDPLAGTSGGHFDGVQGAFSIGPSDKTGRDLRGKGRLEYVGKHHLRHAGSGRFFMKAGTDSPENLLAYADFDGPFKTDGKDDARIKTWAPHLGDWQEGDPQWQNGKGKGLVGAINYLAAEGLNAFSFLTLSIDGDDENVFPYTHYNERLRMDVSRLDQWEIIFEHGTRLGMYLHFKTQETENEKLLDNGNLGNQRKLYYRELIARFSHHLALNWNLGEEINDASTAQKVAWAQYFHDNDPYQHHIVIHNGDQHFDLMGNASEVTGMSKQMNAADFRDTFFDIRRWLQRSASEGKPWVVACDEPGNSTASLRPDSNPGTSHLDARRDALWATIMAGGAGIEFYFGSQYPHSDLTCEDFRSRDSFWSYCRHALWLFENHPFPFELLSNHHELVSGTGSEQQSNSGTGGNRCLARIGDTYLVHLRSGGSHTLNLSAASGPFTVKWYNPRSGGDLIPADDVEGGGIISLGSPPDTPGEDWIVLVESVGGDSGTNSPPSVDAGPDKSAFLDGGSASVALEGSVDDDGLPDEFALTRLWTVVSGPGEVSFDNPNAAAPTATFTEAGSYVLRLLASDSDLEASDEVAVEILQPDGAGEFSFEAVHDAVVNEGANDNGPLLRVEQGLRTAYLRFDLAPLGSNPESAVLFLTEGLGQAVPAATVRVFAALSNDWTEEALDATTAPAKGAQLAVFSGPVSAGAGIAFPLGTHVSGPGSYGFIVEADAGASLAFAADESPLPAARPRLTVTTAPNAPPQFSGYFFTTSEDQTVTIPQAWILAAASDADGDTLSLRTGESASATGGFVLVDAAGLTYTPSIDYLGADSCTVVVEDGRGGSVTATIDITVVTSDGIGNRAPTVARGDESSAQISFAGEAGFVYELQRSEDLVTWISLGKTKADASGAVEFTDPAAPAAAAYYRISVP